MNSKSMVCLVDIHRSETSLIASYLEACGILMGYMLLGE